MSCEWSFPGVPWTCGESAICPLVGPDGVEVGLAVTAAPGDWTVTRDDGRVVLDHGTARTFGRPIAPGDDGCGHPADLVVVLDRTGFGLHRYHLESPGGPADSDLVLVPGPGADGLEPGVALGVALVVAGRVLEQLARRRS